MALFWKKQQSSKDIPNFSQVPADDALEPNRAAMEDVLWSFRDIFDHLDSFRPLPRPYSEFCMLLAQSLAEGAPKFECSGWLGDNEEKIQHFIDDISDATILSLWKSRSPRDVAEMLRHATFLGLSAGSKMTHECNGIEVVHDNVEARNLSSSVS